MIYHVNAGHQIRYCDAKQRNALQCLGMQCGAMQWNVTDLNAMRRNATQCNAMKCNNTNIPGAVTQIRTIHVILTHYHVI